MNPNPKPTRTRSRGLILTEEALNLLDQELRKWWERSAARQHSTTRKLSREAKAEGLGLDEKTVDRVYRREPVDEITLRTAFETLKISPQFSKGRDCVSGRLPFSNLPNVSTPCLGRETEVAKIKTLLEDNPLVSLTGTGGVGKTRLAIQVAEEMKGQFENSIWLVELEGVGLTDQNLVLQRVATTIGVQEEKHCSLIQTLSGFLRGKQLLLIMDNCEHLLEACAKLLHHLLSSSSRLRVLATSRERLNIPFECPFHVPSLALPDKEVLSSEEKDIAKLLLDCDSVRLLVERARVQRPDFTVTNQNAPTLASICNRLDGIPLAIELAAARIGTMLLSDLECGLTDCFRILTRGNRAALPRHQTLRATMDWSYDLLEENEKTLLRRLSVFASDGCPREAAEQVCAGGEIDSQEVLNLLTSLVDKSLTVYQEQDGVGRYRMLETVRQYGRLRLEEKGESDLVQRRHRDYFLALAEKAESHLIGNEQGEWLEQLEAEQANLSTALEWSLSEVGVSTDLRFCGALQKFWATRRYLSEGRKWCVRALGKAGVEARTKERAKALNGAGTLAIMQSDFSSAGAYYEECLSIRRNLDDQVGIAETLNNLGIVAYLQGDFISARTRYDESLSIRRANQDQQGVAATVTNLGNLAYVQGDDAAAQANYEESLRIYRASGDQINIASTLNNMGFIASNQGDNVSARARFEESLMLFRQIRGGAIANSLIGLGNVEANQGNYAAAQANYEESLAQCRAIGDRTGIANTLNNLGKVVFNQGDIAFARDCFEESLTLFQEVGNKLGIPVSLEAFAGLIAAQNQMEPATRLWGAAAALRAKIGSPLTSSEQEAYEHDVEKARQALGSEAFSAAWAQGYSMPLEQAIEYALGKPI